MSSPIPETALPYGVRDVKITPYTNASATTLLTGTGALVDLPNAQTVSFTEQEEFQELRGDDRVVTTRGSGPAGEWEQESGGISFAAYAAELGGTVVESGTTPNIVRSYKKKASDQRPFFRHKGQVISDSGGDFHAYLARCRVTGDASAEFADGEFLTPAISGAMLPSLVVAEDGLLYELVMNETVTDLT